MDWMEDVQRNWKRHNQILVSKDNPLLLSLEALLHGQSHRAMILWALELAEEIVQALKTALPRALCARARPAAMPFLCSCATLPAAARNGSASKRRAACRTVPPPGAKAGYDASCSPPPCAST